uniref:P-loop containing nucleoside triphosphate hydrolase protein n=1 Tax=Mycena chlorophos TaxID=658473 RepID=A0ABQ0LC80_MYCCL|nr:predicted protein [Mycena chlorophos]GAT47456.1 predicted protein [Mycena chlorophos]
MLPRTLWGRDASSRLAPETHHPSSVPLFRAFPVAMQLFKANEDLPNAKRKAPYPQDYDFDQHLAVPAAIPIPPNQRLLVGLAGSPAAGKSSFAHRLLTNIREHEPTVALLVGLDGWHLTRAALDLMPDPALAHERRGAHWTFDADGYVAFITALRAPLQPDMKPIMAPTFSHSIKDPAFDAIRVEEHHRLVIVEGLYPFLSIEPWVEAAKLLDERWFIRAAKLLDERWFIRVDEEEAANRLTKRHVETGICPDAEEAGKRAEGNDLPNGRFIVENMLEPTKYIDSIEDPIMAHELDA